MSDHAWWTPARRKLYGRPTVNGMTCQICGCDMCQCNRLVPVSDPPRAATIGEHVDAVLVAKDAEIERLRAERDENEGAFKVWRRRCQEAERERDEARAEIERLREERDEWRTEARIRTAELTASKCECGSLRSERDEARAEGERQYDQAVEATQRALVAEHDRDAEAENCRLMQDRVQRLTEGNLRLVELLREATSDECVVCGASLHPNMSIPPHCEDCVVEDDVACDHEARVNAFRARIDAVLGGRDE